MKDTIPEAALEYAKNGVAVLPIIRGGDDDKHPYVSETEATTDPETIKGWWKKWPDANVAIATGVEHHLVAVDLDRGHGDGIDDGVEQLRDWMDDHGQFPDTWTDVSAKGGQHWYFYTDFDYHNVQNGQPRELSAVDIRGHNGYCIAPPSISADGKKYFWDIAPDEIKIKRAGPLMQELYKDIRPSANGDHQPKDIPEMITEGHRNGTLTSVAGKLRHEGLTEEEINAGLQEVNRQRCQPPMAAEEVARIAKSVASYDADPVDIKESPQSPETVGEYIRNRMADDVHRLQRDVDRKTGFAGLDARLGHLYPGLYVIGGISSVGKTTFVHQMADQMAADGKDVLYFSLEQSELELISKSIARQTVKDETDDFHKMILDSGEAVIELDDKAVTSTYVRTHPDNGRVKAGTDSYLKAVGDHISVIECNMDCNALTVRDYTEDYIKRTGTRPCVIVDYLQIMSAIMDPDTGRKPLDGRQIVDGNIVELKRLSRSAEVPVIAISSVNRENYLTPIDFTSFKESGCIEFSSDVVLGLQLSVITSLDFELEKNETKKRQMVNAAKAKPYRDIDLVCLKNRYGLSDWTCNFSYWAAQDVFEELGVWADHCLVCQDEEDDEQRARL